MVKNRTTPNRLHSITRSKHALRTRRYFTIMNVAMILALVFSFFQGIVPGTKPPEPALAHNLQTKMVYVFFDQATQTMLDNRITAGTWTPPDPLIQNGDVIGLIIKGVPRDGTTTGVGGYYDFYIPNGTQVVDVAYLIPNGSSFDEIPMKGQSPIAIGDGPIGSNATPALIGMTLGPNINGVTEKAVDDGTGLHRGTIAGVYGDTGIFYSTDPDTAWDTYVKSGGYDGNTGTGDNSITNNSGDVIVPLNKWDAEQLLAYGSKTPAAAIVDPNQRGNAPWGNANAVAGPQSGYAWQFDRAVWQATGNMIDASNDIGPWKRIQYPGSRVSKDQAGLKSAVIGFASQDASTLGVALSPSNPLPQTTSQTDATSPKVIRWSVGQTTLNVPEYVWVQFKIYDNAAILNPDGCPYFYSGVFGGDAGGDNNGKDHLWRYYEPTRFTWNGCLAIGKPATRSYVKVGDAFQYQINFYNLGKTTLTNLIIEDMLPSGVQFLSSVPAQNSGPNPLRWNIGTLTPGQKFSATVSVKAASTGVLENCVTGTADQGTQTACETVISGPNPLLRQSKSVTPTSVAPGGTVQYTILIENIGTGPTGNPVKIDEYMADGFTYVSKDSVKVNGADYTAATTVNSSVPNKPVFSVPASINAGSSLVLKFTARADVGEGTYCNYYTSWQNGLPLSTGTQACVTIGGGKIGDTIFRDWNGDGVQGPEDEGLPGVTVNLYNNLTCTGSPAKTTTTDGDGKYVFSGLTAGNYCVAVTPPSGYTLTYDPVSPNDSMAGVALADGEQRLNIDFGYKPGGTGQIGDTVWKDDGTGGGTAKDGIKNGGEVGIANVSVFLYEDTNGNGVRDPDDALVATTTTNGSGVYSFTGLALAVNYLVQVDESDVDLTNAVCGTGLTCPIGKSKPNPAMVPNLAGTYLDADFGFFTPPPATINGKAFQDENTNGVYDAGDVNIPNTTVRLYRDDNGNGVLDPGETLVATTTTNGTGDYTFTGLPAGKYVVDVDQADPDVPDGYAPSKDLIYVNLAEGTTVNNVDFPFVKFLTKSVDKATANPGETLTYTLRPFYPGSLLLKDVFVTDPIPTGTTYVASSANLGGGLTLTFNPSLAQDTWLNQAQPTFNYGSSLSLTTDQESTKIARILLLFDLPSIPAGATITSATLTLQKTAGDNTARDISAHGVTKPWGEGDKDGAACTTDADDATWNTYDCANNWNSPGGDFIATADATTSVSGNGSYNWNITSLVQKWYDGTLENDGVLLKHVSESTSNQTFTFDSADGATPPTLTFTFSTGEVIWNLGSNVPGTLGIDKSALNIYGFRGDDKNSFWKYDITAGTWSNLANALGTVKEGGALTVAGDYIFGLRGDNSTDFWAYKVDNPSGNTWAARASTPATVKNGGALVYVSPYIYALGGNGTKNFWRYTIGNPGSWTAMTNTPENVKDGGALTTNGTYIYAFRGDGKKDFWRYDITANTWTAMASAPENVGKGGALTFDGTYIYALRGATQKNFWRYNIASNSWSAMTSTPDKVDQGGALTFDGTAIYAFRGNSKVFWRYNIGSNSWTALALTAANVKWGGALVAFGTLGDTAVSLQASPTLISCTGASCPVPVTVVMSVKNGSTSTINNVSAPTNLTICGGAACPGGVTAVKASGPVPATTADLAAGETRTYTYIYNVTAGALLGSITFTGEPDPTNRFEPGISNSVIVTPPLTFQVTINNPQEVPQVENFGQIRDAQVIPVTDSNLVITTLPVFSVSGTVWRDDNVNQAIDAFPPDGGYIQNAAVIVYKDLNNNDKVDPGEPEVGFDLTDASGFYQVNGLPPGNYVIDVYEASITTDETFLASTPANLGVTLGPNATNQNFGYFEGAQIGDSVFHDANRNGILDPGESGLAGVTVTLTGTDLSGNPVTKTMDTVGAGYYQFLVPPGTYTITYDTNDTLAYPDATTSTSYTITVAAGDERFDIDFGVDHTGSIGDRVWNDGTGGNGTQDTGEPGIAGVTLWLCMSSPCSSANAIATTATDGSGKYLFDGLPDGTYYVQVNTATLPAGYTASGEGDPGSACGGSCDSLMQATVSSGGNVTTVDFGYKAPAQTYTVSGNVWNDLDGNGSDPGAGEPGINGVKVCLYQDTNNNNKYDPGEPEVACTTTYSDGNYTFPGVPPGEYVVKVDPTTLPSSAYVQTGDPDSTCPGTGCNHESDVSVTTANPPAENFGYRELLSSITGTVCDGSGDGLCDDTGETPGLANVYVQLTYAGVDGILGTPDDVVTVTTTDTNGDYTFNNLLPGIYQVTKTDPLNKTSLADADGGNPNNISILLLPNVNKLDQDFEVQPVRAEIGNTVWLDENGNGIQDATEPGIPNVTVQLWDSGHNNILATTVTDAHGGYIFEYQPGTYQVDVISPSGMVQSTVPGGAGDFINKADPYTVVLVAGSEDLTADFGFNWAPSTDVTGNTNTGAIGDRVWIDADGDGVQDPEEAGLSGVTVQLWYDSDADGDIDALYPTDGTKTTNATGNYVFDDLPAGIYEVRITGGTSGYAQKGDPDFPGTACVGADCDAKTTRPIVLGPGDVYVNADFGYKPDDGTSGTIGDKVWFDIDGDGVEDAGEPGIPGVTVSVIKDSNGNGIWDFGEPIIATDTTDSGGLYSFPGLPTTDGSGSDDYLVWVNDTDSVLGTMDPTFDRDGLTNPTSGVVSGANITAVKDLAPGPTNDVDFGYTADGHQVNQGIIGDTIFIDRDGGNDFDPGEAVEGVVVELWNQAGTMLLGITVTDENGNYYFGNLNPSATYQVRVPASNFASGAVLEGLANFVDPDGSNDNLSLVTLTPGSPTNLSQDFGYRPSQDAGSISNQVWKDTNANGVKDAGETGIDGVTVDLYRDLNANGRIDPGEPRIGTTTTTGGGTYTFANLPTTGSGGSDPAAEYIVDVTDTAGLLDGAWHSLGTANTNDNSQTDPYAVEISSGAGANVIYADFGYFREPAVIGDYVWQDNNEDGIQDAGEPGLPGITVILTITWPDSSTTKLTTVTGSDGKYVFGNLLLDESYDGVGSPEPIFTLSVDSATLPAGYGPTKLNQGDDNTDSEDPDGAEATVTRGAANTNNSIDFGFDPYPTGVTVVDFVANYVSADTVQIEWTAVNETDITAYNIYRSASPNMAQREKINSQPIVVDLSGNPPHLYTYTDTGVTTQTWYYWLAKLITPNYEEVMMEEVPYATAVYRGLKLYMPITTK